MADEGKRGGNPSPAESACREGWGGGAEEAQSQFLPIKNDMR